jgi:hypothetical protein
MATAKNVSFWSTREREYSSLAFLREELELAFFTCCYYFFLLDSFYLLGRLGI